MNASATLEEAIPDSELHYINFFNGRLLSGEDLSTERDALRAHARLLGQAVGAGVACGLEVSRAQSSPPTDVQVEVKKGLALNKAGQILHLACNKTVSLVRPAAPGKKADCVFWDCELVAGTTLSGDGGYYLFTIAPAAEREGLAPVSGLGNTPAVCNSRYFIEGVQFRLLPMSVSPPSDAAHARSEIAYQCFSLTTKGLSDLATDAVSSKSGDSYALENLVPGLTDCDVPLAVIEWKSGSGLGFTDMWPVRRRITPPDLAGRWSPWGDASARIEGEARFLQFVDHLNMLRYDTGNPSAVKARQHFSFLPAVGILPLATNRFPQSFDRVNFFDGIPKRDPVFMEGARVRHLLELSFDFPALDLNSVEMIWQYFVRENAQAIDGGGSGEPQSYLLFARGQIPFQAEARFDVSRWNYSNFV